ncbi:MAG: hypothetical protein H6708_02475 [Kofleriaceae bacterium]|nr:hypothetical protein [Myxococcales bacterium]MCB9559258.1 hypothetical protein [Kofleriaceae bacterium]
MLGLPLLMGAQGDGCAANSRSPAPDVTGTWDVAYDDLIGVEITIGGSTYTSELGAQGGTVTIDHQGHPITFDLDCARPEILCPSEAWPTEITAEQRNQAFEHRMIVTLPVQACSGQLVAPEAGTCGAGTDNPDCDDVCTGEVTVRPTETFGVIGESGQTFRLYLGGGFATNGLNCALFGWSVADADFDTIGSSAGGDWEAIGMDNGVVTLGYAGGCLWAGDPDDDGTIEALALGASIKFTTGFTADKR